MTTPTAPLPPVVRRLSVKAAPDAAFRRFTTEMHLWWPIRTHSVCGPYGDRVVFEGRPGGRIFERARNGAEFDWGVVTAWDPPRAVAFTWHPGRPEAESTSVEVRFEADGTGTRLTLRHTNWERMGKLARRAQRGYNIGWKGVLDVFAGNPSVIMALTAAIDRVVRIFSKPPIAARLPASPSERR